MGSARVISRRPALVVTRREILQVGYSAMASIGLSSILAGRKATGATDGKPSTISTPARADTVLFIYLTGAPSHIDTFDPKPDAPAEIRGSFDTIATRVPGVRFCEHLPQFAARADKFAVVRTMTQGEKDHERGSHTILTGHDELPVGATNLATRRDWPCFSGGLNFLRPREDGIPNGVLLPIYLRGGEGYSGQHAGLLGARHDPWIAPFDPNDPMSGVRQDELPLGLRVERLDDRWRLLRQIDCQRESLADLGQERQFNAFQQTAVSLLTSGRLTTAFDLAREPDQVRERYGRHLFGQSLLLARRLVEAGVPIIQANMGNTNWWDTHVKNCQTLKGTLLPPFDQAFAALLDDLETRGLLERTLVVMTGEFGRTPKMGGNVGSPFYDPDGRDHWTPVFSSVFAGAGVQPGQVIGKSDRIGAFPNSASFLPSDLGATIYSALGVDPQSQIRDSLGRPLQLNHGKEIEPLYSGRST